ncbi:MAG: hypothetical protein GY854_24610, partial [Deltaproteobacteria bacterium]|nr:hypothetical protein [Deltaproteobacteria bacterium]
MFYGGVVLLSSEKGKLMSLSLGFQKAITEIDVLSRPTQVIAEILRSVCNNLDYRFGSVAQVDHLGRGIMVSSYNLPEDYLAKT